MKKQTFIVSIIIFIGLMFSMGCATYSLWDKKFQTRIYDENIDGFFINQQARQIVFLGQKYHYIFNDHTALLFLLQHKNEQGIDFNIEDGMYTAFDQGVNANLSITLDKTKISQEVLQWAKNFLKMDEVKYNQTTILNMPINMRGTRYIADLKVNEKVKLFQTPIKLNIKETNEVKDGILQTAGKVVLTPLTVAVDAALIVMGIVVFTPVVIVGSVSR